MFALPSLTYLCLLHKFYQKSQKDLKNIEVIYSCLLHDWLIVALSPADLFHANSG